MLSQTMKPLRVLECIELSNYRQQTNPLFTHYFFNSQNNVYPRINCLYFSLLSFLKFHVQYNVLYFQTLLWEILGQYPSNSFFPAF